MNSVILTVLYSAVSTLWHVISGSVFWKTVGKVYDLFKRAFADSIIVKAIKHKGKISLEESSIMCKILRIPTAFLSSLCKLLSGWVRSFADNSPVAAYARGYISGFYSLDVRFFAIMILFGGVSGFIANILKGSFCFSYILLAAAGFLLSFMRIRLADYLDDSVVIKFIKQSFGFENVSFRIYRKSASPCIYGSAAIVGILAGLCSFISPLLSVAAPVGVMGLLTVMAYPISGIFIAVFLAPILPTLAVVGICLLTTFSALSRKAYTGEYGIKMGRCGLCLMLFLIISALSTLFSHSVIGSIGVLGMYIIFIGFYYIIRDTVRKGTTLEAIFKIFAISAAVVSVYGILQYVFGWEVQNAWIDEEMFEEATMRVYSTLANPNVLGEYLILALPITALVIVSYAKTVWQKLVYAALFAATLLCLVLTQSRGCWIGFFISAFVFITYFKSQLWKVLPFLLLLLPFVLPETIINRLLSVGNLTDSSTSYRVFIWLGTFNMLRDFWLGGIGLGEAAFRSVYPYYSYKGIVAPHSHNLYLQIIVESGIVNLIVFISAMLIFFKDMINVQARGRKWGLPAAALLSAVAGFLVQSMFDYTFYNYRVMGIFFMVLALGGALVTISYKEPEEQLEERTDTI